MNEVEEIAKDIESILQRRLNDSLKLPKVNIEKRKLESLYCEVDNMLDEAKFLYDDLKSNGLDSGAIEAEGYLRAMMYMKSYIENCLNTPDEDWL